MLTTGFKLFFGYFLAAVAAAIAFGYTTGGRHVGPLTMGYKGPVGNHVGYGVLVGTAFVSLAIALTLVAFRDADPRAAAELVGLDHVPAQKPAAASYWPLIGAFGAGAVLIGLVLSAAIFVAGLIILGVVAVEWTMQAWADRATGDPEVNRQLRDRIMHPVEVPAAAAIAIVLVPLCFSRVFIAVSRNGAVYVALGILLAIIAISTLVSFRPKVSKNALAGIVLFGGLALIVAGIVAASVGERTFEHHAETSVTTTTQGTGR